MGLGALVVIGGGAYLIHKKHQQKKMRKLAMANGQYPATRSTENFHDDVNAAQQYYNPSEKQPPVYRDQPNPTSAYPNEKGGMQQKVQEIKQ